jgi:hypothetical protein
MHDIRPIQLYCPFRLGEVVERSLLSESDSFQPPSLATLSSSAQRAELVPLGSVMEVAADLDSLECRGQWPACLAGIDHAGRLEQEGLDLVVSAGAMLHAARDNEELARPEGDVTVAELNGQGAFEDEEEFVGLSPDPPMGLGVGVS